MDITTLFKACVKTVRATNKALDSNFNEAKQSYSVLKFRKDVNLIKAKEMIKNMSHLKQFLAENKSAYLNVLNYLSTSKSLNESDREHVEKVAEEVIMKSTNLLAAYKLEIRNSAKSKHSKQTEEHYGNVLSSCERYLRDVSKIYTEAKAIRVKRVIEVHNLSKLGPAAIKNNFQEEKGNSKPFQETISNNSPSPSDKVQLSAEEMQMFESENESLYNELNSMSDEIKQMESKIVHIAELQELFTEKVLQQETDIDRIANVVAGSTEHIRGANEQIRQAIQRNAGLRVWVLFFLLVMSFSLLFLDWYNV